MHAETHTESGAITPFAFDDALVRVVMIDGEPWFVAKDICAVLRIVKTDRAIEKLDNDEKGTHLMSTLGGEQRVSIVSEAGLYTLVLRSRAATTPGTVQHRFRRWVTGEVLPQIRKTGQYAPGLDAPAETSFIPKPANLGEALRMVRELRLSKGVYAARILWDQLGLPNPLLDVEAGAGDAITNSAQHFARTMLVFCDGERVSTTQMREAYRQWCRDQNPSPLPVSDRQLAVAIREQTERLGGRRVKNQGYYHFVGVALRQQGRDETATQ